MLLKRNPSQEERTPKNLRTSSAQERAILAALLEAGAEEKCLKHVFSDATFGALLRDASRDKNNRDISLKSLADHIFANPDCMPSVSSIYHVSSKKRKRIKAVITNLYDRAVLGGGEYSASI